jgi:NAD(P)-dependent dehydrogenase (short-subunit alcohol dehydrogenase family)
MLEMFDLAGRVAVVTGGKRGIGLGIARGLAKAGATLSIWSRDEARNEEARRELMGLGAKVETQCCDVSNEKDVRRCTEATVATLGRIDISFANAGYGVGQDPIEMTLEDWRRLLAVNLDGAFLTLRDAARHMKERGGGGKLIAISSISATFGTRNRPTMRRARRPWVDWCARLPSSWLATTSRSTASNPAGSSPMRRRPRVRTSH